MMRYFYDPSKVTIISLILFCCLFLKIDSLAIGADQNVSTSPLVAGDAAQDTFIVRVFFNDLETAYDIVAGLETLKAEYEKGYLLVEVSTQQMNQLIGMGLRVEIDETYGASGSRLLQSFDAGDVQGIPGYACYRTVEETYDAAEMLATQYPTLAEWIDIGDSWEKTAGLGGYDIMVLKLTNSAIPGPKPILFLSCAIHAREYTTAELGTRFAEFLISGYGSNADVTWLLDYCEVHLILQANPDGRKKAESGLLWRKNTNTAYCSPTSNYRGADVNRNFPFKWDCCGGSSDNECNNHYNGPYALSEPEAQAIHDYVIDLFPDQRGPDDDDPAPLDASGIYLCIHSAGNLVLSPWGYTSEPAPNYTQLQTLGRKLAYFNGYYPKASVDLYLSDGTEGDFVYGELGLARYTFELGTESFQACSYFEDNIVPKNIPSLVYALKACQAPYMLPAGPEAIDLSVQPSQAEGDGVTIRATIDDTRYSSKNGVEAAQVISGAEYYVDGLPWSYNSPLYQSSMEPSDGRFDSTAETVEAVIDTSGWSDGRHTIFVRGHDAAGNWGVFSAVFIDTPVLPNVGNTSIFESTSTLAQRRAMPYTMPQDGTINSLTMYHDAGSGKMILGVYADTGDGTPGNRLGVTPETDVTNVSGWQTIALDEPIFMEQGTPLWLAWVYENNPGVRYQIGSPGRAQSSDTWGAGMPSDFGPSSISDYIYSIYANYESTDSCSLASKFGQAALAEGMQYYTDRDYTLTHIPSQYIGLPAILTPNDERNLTMDSGYITFQMPYEGVVYVGYDSRAIALPDWMQGFADTGHILETSLSTQPSLKIYSKMVSAGVCVNLGANKATGFSGNTVSNYIVFTNPDSAVDTELVCNDGIDNDADGLIDCQDPDCEDSPYCNTNVILSSSFDADAEGFTYTDDPFYTTSQPLYAKGAYTASGGYSGGGGLQVTLGGVDYKTILSGISGGWSQTFYVAEAMTVQIDLQYRLVMNGFDSDECAQVLVSIDGGPAEVLDEMCGRNKETGWVSQSLSRDLSAGSHTLTIGGFNNKKTAPSELADIYFDNVQITGGASVTTEADCSNGVDDDGDALTDCLDPDCDGVAACEFDTELTCNDAIDNDADGAADCQDPDCEDSSYCDTDDAILSSSFDEDADGFTYADDPFYNTSQPTYAKGAHVSSGGYAGSGGLQVTLGGIDYKTILSGISGGWSRTFNVVEAMSVQIDFQYRLVMNGYDSDECAQVLVSIDGGSAEVLDEMCGRNKETGWVKQVLVRDLSAGSHTLTIGGFNNKKTALLEFADIYFDNVNIQ